ncbi:MAG: DUF3791 domain-containing protein [Clostridia bacterium]|nr:DUF3791 domain-containing protein [Clostridia bacterium]
MMYTENDIRARYMVMCVNEFAARKKMDRRSSFRYLYNNKGIQYLMEHYDIEHTLPINDTIDALTIVCMQNGGTIQ